MLRLECDRMISSRHQKVYSYVFDAHNITSNAGQCRHHRAGYLRHGPWYHGERAFVAQQVSIWRSKAKITA